MLEGQGLEGQRLWGQELEFWGAEDLLYEVQGPEVLGPDSVQSDCCEGSHVGGAGLSPAESSSGWTL